MHRIKCPFLFLSEMWPGLCLHSFYEILSTILHKITFWIMLLFKGFLLHCLCARSQGLCRCPVLNQSHRSSPRCSRTGGCCGPPGHDECTVGTKFKITISISIPYFTIDEQIQNICYFLIIKYVFCFIIRIFFHMIGICSHL